MSFVSIQFLVFAFVVVMAFNASSNVSWREAVVSVANLIFIASFITSPLQAVPLTGFLLFGYLSHQLIQRHASPLLGSFLIVLIVSAFVSLKRYAFVPSQLQLTFLYLQVGLSYILFRILQLVIDGAHSTDSVSLSPLQFVNYTCNWLCFVSGPIQRSEQFICDGRKQLGRYVDDQLALRALARIARGYFKLAVLSAFAQYLFTKASLAMLAGEISAGQNFDVRYAASVVTYTVYLYTNFAGYMDIVIGLGWLLGQELPENFNRPFSARNLFEFWARWHITLSEWFKTYLFNPLVKSFAGRIENPKALPYLGVLAFFISFFVMGVWHGSTMVFVIYGLVMGAGVVINKLWQIALTRHLGKKNYRSLTDQAIYATLARGLTFSFFALAITGLWVDVPQLALIARQLGAEGALLVFIGTALAASLVFAATHHLERIWPSAEQIGATIKKLRIGQIAIAAEILTVLLVASFFHKAPEFVYKAF